MSRTARVALVLTSVTLVGVSLATFVLHAARTVPGKHLLLVGVGLALLLGFGVLWLVALILVLVARREVFPRGGGLVLLAAVLVGGHALLPVWDHPMQQLGFALARPGLDSYLSDGTCPERVGPYPVDFCLEAEDGTRVVIIEGAGFLNSAGYAFADEQKHEPGGQYLLYDELGGGWWTAVLPWD